MGLIYIAWGPEGQTHTVRYVCSDKHGSDCLAAAIREHISPEWAKVCQKRDRWYLGDTVYEIGYTPNDSDANGHEYCWAYGDLVTHGDGTDQIDRIDDRVCTEDECTWPEYVEVPAYFTNL